MVLGGRGDWLGGGGGSELGGGLGGEAFSVYVGRDYVCRISVGNGYKVGMGEEENVNAQAIILEYWQ